MLRHLPPTASPLSLAELWQGVRPSPLSHERFRQALSRSLNGAPCLLAASGRAALALALRGLRATTDSPSRREVLLPAYTCPALVPTIRDAGLQPRLVDLSPETLALDEAAVAARLGPRTLALLVVHPFGLPQPLDGLQVLAHAAGASVIEDAAQAMGARWAGQPVGTWGDVGLFSLGPGKPLSTGGGGVLCVNRPALAEPMARAWAALPPPTRAASASGLARAALFGLAFHPVGWWLVARLGLHRAGDDVRHWGYALRDLSAAQAALGAARLARLPALNARRRANAQRLVASVQGLPCFHIPPVPTLAEPIFLRLPLLVASAAQRERLVERLGAAGIGAGRLYRRPLAALFPELASEPFPGAAQVAERLLTLPTHPYLTEADIARIVRLLRAEEGSL